MKETVLNRASSKEALSNPSGPSYFSGG